VIGIRGLHACGMRIPSNHFIESALASCSPSLLSASLWLVGSAPSALTNQQQHSFSYQSHCWPLRPRARSSNHMAVEADSSEGASPAEPTITQASKAANVRSALRCNEVQWRRFLVTQHQVHVSISRILIRSSSSRLKR